MYVVARALSNVCIKQCSRKGTCSGIYRSFNSSWSLFTCNSGGGHLSRGHVTCLSVSAQKPRVDV